MGETQEAVGSQGGLLGEGARVSERRAGCAEVSLARLVGDTFRQREEFAETLRMYCDG